ncbi:LuxR family transcriptional regulator [Salmonella enterica subsp. enterica]|uniref:LuxR family transcriptional regulator n=1 Tax=Salmonella enterica I TaxID=59201 RepID=A0A379VZW8_SALET|nr:LuxR family transcriptional regulator [Salmonella enterica subsp. enterica]
MMERLLGKKVLYLLPGAKNYVEILVIDRCHFTRTGMEAWLNHTDVLSSSLLVSGMNNLILAKEHILQWKPHLVIADLYGFLNDALPEQPINAFFAACRMTPLVLLQSGNMPYRPQYASHAVLSKHTLYMSLHNELKERYITHPLQEAPESATPLLSPQEKKCSRCGRKAQQ